MMKRLLCPLFHSLNLCWLFLAVVTSLILKMDSPNRENTYLLAQFILPLILGGHLKRTKTIGQIGTFSLFLGVLAVMTINPPYENDHIRYLAEAISWRLDLNPFEASPLEVMEKTGDIIFLKAGYPSLEGIYPPFFSWVLMPLTYFSHEYFFLVMAFAQALIIRYLFQLLSRTSPVGPWFKAVLLCFLFREGIVQLHYELFAAAPLILAYKSKRPLGFYSGLFFSFAFKFWGLLGLSLLPYKIDRGHKKPKLFIKGLIIFCFFILLSLGLFIHLGYFKSSGLLAFKEKWLFGSTFYHIFHYLLGFPLKELKVVSLLLFVLLAYFAFKKVKKEACSFMVVIFGVLILSPVFNSWYACWTIIPFLFLEKEVQEKIKGVFPTFLYLTPLLYTYHQDWGPLYYGGTALIHLLMGILVMKLLVGKVVERPVIG